MRAPRRGGPSFPSIVAAGENGALPHATPARRRRSPRARWSRSTSAPSSTATARTARARGRRASCPRTWTRSTRLVLEAQVARWTRSAPASAGRDVDAVARDLIAAAGHGEHFGHGLGHGVGLEVHEAPRLARTVDERARARQRRHRRAGRLRAGPRRRADRGSRRGHRRAARRAQRRPEGAHPRGVETPSPQGGTPGADNGRDGTPSPHPLSLRRAAMLAALAALLVPATPGARRRQGRQEEEDQGARGHPVRPMNVAVGEQLTIRGKQLRVGRNKNTVVFKRDGARAVFVEGGDRARRSCCGVKVPATLQEFFGLNARRAGRRRASASASWPRSSARASRRQAAPRGQPAAAARRSRRPSRWPDGDCDGDGKTNKADADDDNDALDRRRRDVARPEPLLGRQRR